jgi:hypothetical protein
MKRGNFLQKRRWRDLRSNWPDLSGRFKQKRTWNVFEGEAFPAFREMDDFLTQLSPFQHENSIVVGGKKS